MKHWLRRVLGVVLAGSMAAGCKQQMFLSKECYDQAHGSLPAHVEGDLSVGDVPLMNSVKDPATLRDPDRPMRNLTLREAFAIALENGSASDRGAGQVDDTLPQFSSGSAFNAQTDRIKALALNPAIAGANLEASLARFDAHWVTAMNWSVTDNLTQGLNNFQNGNNAAFSSSLVKGLPSGGVAAVSFLQNYRNLSSPPNVGVNSVFNPFYESRLQFGFEQPLWRDYGTDINQLLSRFPSFNGTGATNAAASFNSRQLSGNNLGIGSEGILISRIRIDQQRAEFERRVQNMLLNVETAYWRLYQAYGRLYSFEEVMRIAHKSWLTNQAKYVAGTIGPANYHPIRGQYEEFRGERMAALGGVLESERNLRGLLGMPVEDGTRLVPIDTPTLAPYQPNWDASVQMALMQKPELTIARDNLRVAQFALVSQKNFLKPDLRFVSQYAPYGAGTRLDGNGGLIDGQGNGFSNNSFRSLANGNFADWTVGLTMSMPLGFRLEHAAVRAARLQLAQSYYLLKDSEERTTRALAKDYQKLAEWHQLIEARRAERKAYADSVEARYREFAVGKATVADFLLEAQRRLASAQVKEYEAIAEYNISLASFEYRKGNLLKHDSIVIAEGALPDCVEVRAVDHERERSKAIALREKPEPIHTPARMAGNVNNLPLRLDVPPDVQQTSTGYSPVSTTVPTTVANPGGATILEPVGVTPAFRSMPSSSNAAPTPARQVLVPALPPEMPRALPSMPVSSAPPVLDRAQTQNAATTSVTAPGFATTIPGLRATPRSN